MTSPARQVLVVLVTCPSAAVGRRISRRLVQQRLAACVNLVPQIESIYRWQGKVEQGREALLIMKTSAKRFAALQAAILRLHPYESPEIIAWPLSKGVPAYLRWVLFSV